MVIIEKKDSDENDYTIPNFRSTFPQEKEEKEEKFQKRTPEEKEENEENDDLKKIQLDTLEIPFIENAELIISPNSSDEEEKANKMKDEDLLEFSSNSTDS